MEVCVMNTEPRTSQFCIKTEFLTTHIFSTFFAYGKLTGKCFFCVCLQLTLISPLYLFDLDLTAQ